MSARGIDKPYTAVDQTIPTVRHDARRHALTRWASPSGVLGLIVAALLGLLFAHWLYGYAMLRGTAPFWWRDDSDITQYLAGFNAFVHEPWHWPLLRINSLNAPQGTLATFVDTVPLYAAFLKVVHPGAGYWNPYGLWIALCFALQGVGAWWICREAKMRDWTVLVAMTLLLVSFPALTARIAHTSLMSQWLVLFALAIYLRSGRLGQLARGSWIVLVPCAFYINIYLFAMASTIFAADVVRELQRAPFTRAAARRVLLAPAMAYGILFISMWITMLPLPAGAGSAEWGFGYYSMNLLAPVHGGLMLQIDHPIAHDGQGEGYNYLGVFVLALTAWVVRLRHRHDPAFWCRHRALHGVLVMLTLYAISNMVTFGSVHLFTLYMPPKLSGITSTFRSSGRFFWPVGYAIIVFTVLGVARHLPRGRAAAVLVALVTLHLWDLTSQHERVRATVAQVEAPKIDTVLWDSFLGTGVHALHYYPPFHCAVVRLEALLPTMAYAVQRHYALSTGYIARASKPCDHFDDEIAHLPATTAVIFEKQVFPKQQDAERLMGPGAVCIDVPHVFLCRRNTANLAIH